MSQVAGARSAVALALSGVMAIALLAAAPADGQDGSGRKRRPLPSEYGRVVLTSEASVKAKLAPVVFDHWLHRAKFTCRLCHVDIGFAMKTGATHVKASDNEAGAYCGACHDGKLVVDGRKVFPACNRGGREVCARCHSQGLGVKPVNDFATFTRDLPRGRFGNGVDWEVAEEKKLIKPIDYLENVSIKRQSLTAQKDFALAPKQNFMPEIIFSHAKHTVWSGCEGCHPDIFMGVKRGATKYTMVEIFEGKYCGACHQSVAFPTTDCQRCHTKAVQ